MKNKMFFIIFFIVLSMINSVFAETWWDAKDVKRTEDGCIEYSLYLKNFINKDNGDVFSGVVVQKYGKFNPYRYSKYTNNICKSSTMREEHSVVSLKGTINGKNISNIALFTNMTIKYISHRDSEKCKNYVFHQGKKKEVTPRDKIVKRKGIEVLDYCKCPVIEVVEPKPVLTAENRLVWEMMYALNIYGSSQNINLLNETLKIDESCSSYLEPNMFNGTYVVNGEVRTLDLYKVKKRFKDVRMYPLRSVYEDSAIFTIYETGIRYKEYCVYKDGDVWKAQNKIYGDWKYIEPTEELISYAMMISRILGININH